ncbi:MULTISPECIES: transposase [spotted fever group]|uniref:transposase n=2 Tax=Rickettsia TaxID=780 RepID=UPI0010708892|nr:transposase [Rickettsia australis]
MLETIPGIGTINASILSIKPVEAYDSAKDFAASLGIVPKQNSTGGKIILGRITKQGDRYARTMLIQAGRSLLMRSYKTNQTSGALSEFIERLKEKGKSFNVIAVAIANKLARIAYACLVKNRNYQLV